MYGILQVVFKNRNMILNPKFRFLGMVVLPEVLLNIFFLPVTLVTNFLFILLFVKAFGGILGYSLTSIPYLSSVESSRIYELILFFIATYTISLLLAIYRDRSTAKWSLIWQIPFSLFVYRNALWALNILVIFKVFKGKRQGWNHFHKVGQRRSRNAGHEYQGELHGRILGKALAYSNRSMPLSPAYIQDLKSFWLFDRR